MKNYYYPTGEVQSHSSLYLHHSVGIINTPYQGMSASDFSEDRMRYIYLILFVVGVVLFALHQYVEQIYPAEYGIPKHPLFFMVGFMYYIFILCFHFFTYRLFF